MAKREESLVMEALKRFRTAAESSSEQRKAMLEAKAFRAGNQWPDEVKIQRQGGAAVQGVAAQPARPCLTIDRLSGPVRQVSNGIKQADFSLTVLPNEQGADQQTADFLKGWLRRIQNEARADDPIGWAGDSAAECGIGWFRILSVYTDDNSFDQDLKLERIANALTVYSDPAALKPTRSDMRYLFLTQDLPRDEFKRQFPKADLVTLDEFRSVGDDSDWITEDTVRVAEYWYVEYDKQRVVELIDGSTLVDPEMELDPTHVRRERVVFKPKVKWAKITCTEVLEDGDWLGTKIPFVPILGEEMNVDGKTILRGIIQPGMDAQRMLNYAYSGAIEALALAPKAPYIVAEGQIESYKFIWQNANTFNYATLPYTPVDLNGQPVPPPQRNAVEAPIQAMVQMMSTSEAAIKFTTGQFDIGLGQVNQTDQSGRAIEAIQNKGEFGVSHYLENTKNALIYACTLMLEMAPKILDRPGRMVRIHGADNKPEMGMIGQGFVRDQQGTPQPAQINGQQIFNKALAQLAGASFYDIAAGTYGVTVDVGKASVTKLREGSQALGALIPALPPEMGAAITPEFIQSLDFPGAADIAAKARRALPPGLQDGPQGDMARLPPQVQQQLAQIPQLQAALQEAQQVILGKQVEKNAELQRAAMETESRKQIAALQEQTKLIIEQAKLNQRDAQAMLANEQSRLQLMLDQAAQHADRQHEVALQAAQHGAQMMQQQQAQQAQGPAGPPPAGPPMGGPNG